MAVADGFEDLLVLSWGSNSVEQENHEPIQRNAGPRLQLVFLLVLLM